MAHAPSTPDTSDLLARIAALEARVARLEQQAASQARARRGREIDPGDAVPPGVAVLEVEPMDAPAQAALDAIQKHIPGG